jgi:hypothetical protein
MINEEFYEEQYGNLGWKAPYMAATYDWIGQLNTSIEQNSKAKFGYIIKFKVMFFRASQNGMGFIDTYLEEIGIRANVHMVERENKKDQIRLTLSSRDDIRTFLKSVQPYLIVRFEETEILLNEVFPALDEKRHVVSEEGFVEVVELIDHFREHGSSDRRTAHTTHDADYFREEFGL